MTAMPHPPSATTAPSISRARFLACMAAAAGAVALRNARADAPVTLRLHHFLAPTAPSVRLGVAAWAQRVQKASAGRIRVQIFPAMQLGGKPADLLDQAIGGVVDLVWTVLGYTPGRFARTEVFELPFLTRRAAVSSAALHDYIQTHAGEEFADVRLIAAHTHGAGVFHSHRPITRLEDLRGMKVRGGSRIINRMLDQLGAVPVGLSAPQVGEALSRRVIDAATLPWEVTPALRIAQMVRHHTGFASEQGLYTQTFALLMNRSRYAALPADLRGIIDAHSGVDVARAFGQVMDEADTVGLEQARRAGNTIVMLDETETRRWMAAAEPTRQGWFQEMHTRGHDGPAMLAAAQASIAKFSQ